jgi:TonB-linked SusC/RagA family outer membrane protein
MSLYQTNLFMKKKLLSNFKRKWLIPITGIRKKAALLMMILSVTGYPLAFSAVSDNTASVSSQQQTREVSGVVTDEKGDPIPGANILIKGTTRGTISDIDGHFSLNVSGEESPVLVISFIGYETQELGAVFGSIMSINLKPTAASLDEVVVVGYGTQKKVSVTASVTSIGTDELVQSPTSNISNSLAGRLPGLVAIQSSGEPGNDQATLKIRGIGTLRTGEESDPLILVDGVERESMNMLDPNEIESINVLKDASATAVFGVRGANGVILITTKTGKEGPPKISFSGNWGLQSVTKIPDMVNAYEYAILKNEGLENDREALGLTNDPIPDEVLEILKNGSDPIMYPDVDWFDKLLKKTSLRRQYNVNISGGTDITKYFVSLGYYDQEGQYNYSNLFDDFDANARYKRYNVRSNFDINVARNLEATVKLGLQVAESSYPGKSATGADGVFFDVLKANPLSSPGIIDGKLITGYIDDPLNNILGGRGTNPIATLLSDGFKENFNSTLNLNIGLKYNMDFVTKGLLARGRVAYDSYYKHDVKRSRKVETYNVGRNEETGALYYVKNQDTEPFGFKEEFDKWRYIYTEVALEYNHGFGPHNVTGLVLYNQGKTYDPDLAYHVPHGVMGLVSRVTYNYDNRYMGEFNLGYNGSENFPKEKRFGFFPAYSLGWVISEESFFPKNNWVTFLKIRGSYGEVGNDKIGGDRFLYLPSVFNYTGNEEGGYYFGEEGTNRNHYYGSAEGKLGNPIVTWERAKKMNIGFEMNLLKNRFSFTADYFQEKRDNILWDYGTISSLVAADLPAANIGKVDNGGFELEGEWRDNFRKLNYWVKANISYNHNEIKYKDEPKADYPWMMDTGYSVGQFKGYKTDGFINTYEELANVPVYSFGTNVQRGDLKYVDINGDGIIDYKDKVPIGYTEFPEIVYGISFGGDFKGFDFSVLFQGADHVSNRLTEMAAWPFDQGSRNAQKFHLNRWTEERYENGEEISYPRMNYSGAGVNNQPSDFWIQSASYIRLKNAEIGYRFKPGILDRFGVESLRLYVNGNNLITWTDMKTYDPEAPSGRGEFYPQMRVINFGFNLQF